MKNIFQNILLIILLILIIVLAIYYFQPNDNAKKYILFEERAIVLNKNDKYQLKINKSSDEKVIYQVENENIAIIDENGFLIAINVGNTKVKAMLESDSAINDELTIIVNEALSDKVPVKDLSFTQKVDGMLVNQRIQLNVTIKPSNATNKKIVWLSDNPNVAIVDSNGVVTSKKEGIVNITAKSHNNKIATIKINVTKNKVEVDKVILNKDKINLDINKTFNIEAIIMPTNATNQKVEWTSTDSSVAAVDSNGLVTAKKVGTAIIKAKSGNKVATCTITVSKKDDTLVVNLIEKEYTGNIINAIVKSQSGIKASITYYTDSACKTKTSLVNALDVGGAPKKAGMYYIIATTAGNNFYNSAKTLCTKAVIIKEVKIDRIILNKTTISLYVGLSENLNATIEPANVADKTLTWSSSDENIVSVNNGKITANKVGNAVVTVKTSNGKTAMCKVIIKNNKFQNPLKKADGTDLGGGDPFVTYNNGKYYYLSTNGYDIKIAVSKNLHEISIPERTVTVWVNPNKKVVWAPELHYLRGRWYIYFTNADNDDYLTRRMYVLRSKTTDPVGEYEYMGKIYDSKHDYVALDGTAFEWNNELYYVYSGHPEKNKHGYQSLYIAHMSNPYTLDSERVLISKPDYSWEKEDGHINEGPEILIKNGVLNIIYSANGAQSKYYSLGMLTYNGTGSLLSKSSWTKSSKPLFQSGNGVYGPGHCSFTKSPDGKEDWIVYHAYNDNNKSSYQNWLRYIRMQSFTWNGNVPVFGSPVATNVYINVPSGSKP